MRWEGETVPYRGILKFADGTRMPLNHLLGWQGALVEFVPTCKGRFELLSEVEQQLHRQGIVQM
ncbi:hypothetical protein HYW59_04980 [Candidatus Kaiserbacteria bacterium]|nr:hypothetical protein [Candidatus Kaiserbacteria bacterium]